MSTQRTTNSRFKSLNTKWPHHCPVEIQVLAWKRHTCVTVLNGVIAPPINNCIPVSNAEINKCLYYYWAFQHFDFERTWWRLFQKRVVRTKFDIYVFMRPFHPLLINHKTFEYVCCTRKTANQNHGSNK